MATLNEAIAAAQAVPVDLAMGSAMLLLTRLSRPHQPSLSLAPATDDEPSEVINAHSARFCVLVDGEPTMHGLTLLADGSWFMSSQVQP